ncbi:uncharacterized protein N7459_006974 [Penicillium hispanicum]|uniref:uncharacterized protein n=1 Tax=Penicillium hispanicum TaxID=1080232 RepID=UPI002541E260|nr:uncharacterized protein N7459_006974 [Penicillium hispanicum]KAJ5578010.1 hypothetical protein N7459_006974 [Penicillium hispanicum]
MALRGLSGLSGLSSNMSLGALEVNDPLFYVCWRRQSCSHCLAGDVGCSWCAISSTCVPNAARVPILAPLSSTDICPLGSKERWELRALPLGCHASTMTVLSVVVAVLGVFVSIGVGLVTVWLVQRVRQRWKQTNPEYDRLDGQEEGVSRWFGWLDCGVLLSLVGFVGQGQRPRQASVEEGREAESRPLLE